MEWKTLLKWMIWGYHYFRKAPYISITFFRKSPYRLMTVPLWSYNAFFCYENKSHWRNAMCLPKKILNKKKRERFLKESGARFSKKVEANVPFFSKIVAVQLETMVKLVNPPQSLFQTIRWPSGHFKSLLLYTIPWGYPPPTMPVK